MTIHDRRSRLAAPADRRRTCDARCTVRYAGNAQPPSPNSLPTTSPPTVRSFGSRPHAIGGAGSDLIAAIDAMNLSGRGGGHFPVAAKWRAVRAAGPRPWSSANGAEGEPLSRKDAALLELRPHLVLDGLALAAEAAGRRRRVALAARGRRRRPLRSVTRALTAASRGRSDRARDARSSSDPTATSAASPAPSCVPCPGGPALPLFRRPPTAVSGVDGRPTLVQNVETLARVGLARARLRRPRPVDPRHGRLRPANASSLEVDDIDAPCATAVALGSARAVPQAVLVGGYGGSWAPWSAVADVRAQRAPRCARTGSRSGPAS